MDFEVSKFHEDVTAPTPQMLHSLARAAFEYAIVANKLEVDRSDTSQPVYYLKDFKLQDGNKVGRVARFSSEPLLEIDVEDESGQTLKGVANAYSFYYSERVEHDEHGQREEWRAFGYRWNDENKVLRAARWAENYPAVNQSRSSAESTASDVHLLIHEFRARQHAAQRAA